MIPKNIFINVLSDMRNIDFDIEKINSLMTLLNKKLRDVS